MAGREYVVPVVTENPDPRRPRHPANSPACQPDTFQTRIQTPRTEGTVMAVTDHLIAKHLGSIDKRLEKQDERLAKIESYLAQIADAVTTKAAA